MSREAPERTKKFLEELKQKVGGIDFTKEPPTQREMYECVKKLGCVYLPEIAFNRRRLNIRKVQK